MIPDSKKLNYAFYLSIASLMLIGGTLFLVATVVFSSVVCAILSLIFIFGSVVVPGLIYTKENKTRAIAFVAKKLPGKRKEEDFRIPRTTNKKRRKEFSKKNASAFWKEDNFAKPAPAETQEKLPEVEVFHEEEKDQKAEEVDRELEE